MNIRVSLIEDNVRARNALQTLLDGTPGFCCLSAHGTAEDAVQSIPQLNPDVVVQDLKLPRMCGVECLRQLKALRPGLQILVLTQFDESGLIFDSLKAGASGYVLKSTPLTEILAAIQVVCTGGSMMTPSVARRVIGYFRQLPVTAPPAQALSDREQQVLQLAKKGLTYERIAKELGIEFNTVRTHFRNIYQKLEVNSRSEAVAKYFQL